MKAFFFLRLKEEIFILNIHLCFLCATAISENGFITYLGKKKMLNTFNHIVCRELSITTVLRKNNNKLKIPLPHIKNIINKSVNFTHELTYYLGHSAVFL